MSTLAISYTFSPTTVIESGQVNQNFTDIVNYINNTASPVGLVAMWKGSIASIPTGWAIDTDLRDKMAIGAGNLYAYGDTGGEAEHTLTTAEIPSHNHTQDAHQHTIFAQLGTSSSNRRSETGSGNYSGTGAETGNTSSVVATNQATGGGGAHNNLPPYYALAYIRRT